MLFGTLSGSTVANVMSTSVSVPEPPGPPTGVKARPVSHSSVERVIGPDATILCDYALARMTRIVSGMVVDAERMKHNLDLTGGLVYSQGVLLALVRAGMEREKAYEVVQKKALESWDTGKPLKDLLLEDLFWGPVGVLSIPFV